MPWLNFAMESKGHLNMRPSSKLWKQHPGERGTWKETGWNQKPMECKVLWSSRNYFVYKSWQIVVKVSLKCDSKASET